MEFKDSFVGFVDILGFKNLVEDAESGKGKTLSELLSIQSLLGSDKDMEDIRIDGPCVCPRASRNDPTAAFCLTQASDSVVVSTEVSPSGALTIINHCYRAACRLLKVGLMCRGYITRGPFYHTPGRFLGSGFHEAHRLEGDVSVFKQEADERGTPFIEIAPAVCTFVDECGDDCVKEVFERLVKREGNVAAVFPFRMFSLAYSPALGSSEDLKQARQSIDILRTSIRDLKTRVLDLIDKNNVSAVSKAKHYCRALDRELAACDRNEEMLTAIDQPFSAVRLRGGKPPREA